MKKILITGASGFIGTNLLSAIQRRRPEICDEILLLSSSDNPDFHTVIRPGFELEKGVFNEFEVEIVVHAGAFTPKNSAQINDVKGSDSNLIFTKSLCEALPSSMKKFIFLSTIDVYTKSDEAMSESSEVAPSSLYGKSKLNCENYLRNWSSEKNIELVILRIGHIYGPGESAYEKLVPMTIRKVLKDESPKMVGTGRELRSLLYVEDCVNKILQVIEEKIDTDLINMVSSKSYSIREILEAIISVSGKNLKIKVQNPDKYGSSFTFDSERMISLLGPEEYTLVEGLKREYDFERDKLR